MKSGVTIALLAYKEEENLKVLIPLIQETVKQLNIEYEIIVVDTEKPLDNTLSICKKYGCKYINQELPHFGGAFKTAIKYAEMDKFLILDADGSHPPVYITEMYKKFVEENCDIVIGSRYVKGGITKDSRSSIIMSKILNTVFRIAMGIKAHDISTDYRIYETEQLKKVSLENENYDVLQEVLLKMKINNKNLKIGEVPITFEKRMYGESKRRLLPFIVSYITSLIKLICIRFPILKNMVLYGIIGGCGAVIEFLIFLLLLRFSDIAEVSNMVGGVCGFCFTFTMNTFFNFKKKDKLLKRLVSYGGICALGLFFSTLIIHLLQDYTNVVLLKLILLVIVALFQFILNKKVTYKN